MSGEKKQSRGAWSIWQRWQALALEWGVPGVSLLCHVLALGAVGQVIASVRSHGASLLVAVK